MALHKNARLHQPGSSSTFALGKQTGQGSFCRPRSPVGDLTVSSSKWRGLQKSCSEKLFFIIITEIRLSRMRILRTKISESEAELPLFHQSGDNRLPIGMWSPSPE
jgi:hypothetical protein